MAMMSAMTDPPHEATAEPAVRIALADDDVLLREGMASLLEQHGFEVIGQSGDATELLSSCASRSRTSSSSTSGCRRPPTEGLEAARVIRREFPEVAIPRVSGHVEVYDAWSCSPAASASVMCSRTGSPTWTSSSTLSCASREEDRSWT
jgi:DNA-binding NarL/FixJ family response regulator